MFQSVIGTGPHGFTALGLDLLRSEVLGGLLLPADAEVSVEVPQFSVIAADLFSEFLERNRIGVDELSDVEDSQIALRFQRGELPAGLMEELREVAESMPGPLFLRSSSTLEETMDRSIGGVYLSKLIPNSGDNLEKRTRHLVEAIKLVWASTYFADAVSWRLGAGVPAASERMAVVVQRAVGATHGERFYPTVSAVARSYNHYPVPGDDPGDGVVTVVLGLGRTIAEGHAWSYCPERPTAPPPFKSVHDLLRYSQTSFWALDLGGATAPDPTREGEHLVRLGLADAERDGTLELLASTYDAESDRLRSGFDGTGPRALTFAPLLRSKSIPFSSVIKSVLEQARVVTGREVEIEIAATLDPVAGVPIRFGLVQLKSTTGRPEGESLELEELTADGVIAASTSCLGNGVRRDLADVVYLKPGAFDRHQTRIVAAELEAVNRGLLEEARSAIFIGFGRWGTTDDRYGVPVRWGQISTAQVIVEITLPDAPLNLSHGTHFFHHLLSQRVLYLSVEHDGVFEVDFSWLDDQAAQWEGRYVRHVRLDGEIEVNIDGARRRGLIRRVPG